MQCKAASANSKAVLAITNTAVCPYLCADDILNNSHSRSRGCPILEGQGSRALPQQHPEAGFSGSSCGRQVVAALKQNCHGCYGLQHGCHVPKALFSHFAPAQIPGPCLLGHLESMRGDLQSSEAGGIASAVLPMLPVLYAPAMHWYC